MPGARWVVGVLLLTVGMLGTLRIISEADRSVPVWVTTRVLMPGERISRGDLVARRVRLGETGRNYVPAGDEHLLTRVVQHVIAAGELVPRSGLGPPLGVEVRSVTVVVPLGEAATVRHGGHAQVWLARPKGGTGPAYEKPQKVVERAPVGRISGSTASTRPVGELVAVQVFVPQEVLGDLIDAINARARITLVPDAGPHGP